MKQNTKAETTKAGKWSWLIAVPFALVTVFLGWVFIFQTFVPHLQMRDYKIEMDLAINHADPQPLINDTFIFKGNDYAQGLLRATFLSGIFEQYNMSTFTAPSPLLDKSLKEIDAYDARYPYRYDYFLNAGKAYDLQAVLYKDQNYAAVAQHDYETALGLAKDRQDIIYPLANNLVNLGLQGPAIALIQQSIAETPGVIEGHYRLAELYTLAGPAQYDQALTEFEMALNQNFNPDKVLVREMYDRFLRYYYTQADIPHFTTVLNRLILINPDESSTYNAVLSYISAHGTLPIINIVNAK